MSKGITIAGSIIVDNIKYIDDFPKRGNLVNISRIEYNVGGCVSNTICQLRCLAPDMFLKAVGIIGNDDSGRLAMAQLKKFDINVDDVAVSKELPTAFSDCMTEKDGQRTFLNTGGAGNLIDYEFIKGIDIPTDFFHIGYPLLLKGMDAPDPEYGTVMARTLDMVGKRGIKTSMDVVSMENPRAKEIITAPAPYLTFFIVNEVELALGTGIAVRDSDGKINEESIKKACCHMIDSGVKEWVIIHAPEGGWAMDAGKNFTYVPSLKLPAGFIKGSVGAGDAFCAGTLFGLNNSWDIEKILRFASGSAAACLSASNTTDGMRTEKGIWELIKELDK